jgi:PKD repeat protein
LSSIATWSWDFDGDGVEDSNLQNPVFTYTIDGAFKVTLTVTDSLGCISSAEEEITASPLPVANFDFRPNVQCVGEEVQFMDTSLPGNGSIVSWSWDFDGDGAEDSNVQNPIHIYSAAGTFTITLRVANSNSCEASISKTIRIHPLPIADFEITPESACVGDTVEFTDASTSAGGAIVSWSWDFDGDGVEDSGLQNPAHTYNSSGTFTITLVVEDVNGCSDSASKNITISEAVADFTATPDTVCVGEPVQFTDASTSSHGSIVSWSWDFDGDRVEDSNLQNPSHTYPTDGTFTVTLTVEDSDTCTASATKEITVNPLPVADFTFAPPAPCVGDPVQFADASTSTGGAIVSWSWDFDGDGVEDSNAQNPSHTYVSAGIFTISLSIEDANGCLADTSRDIEVFAAPAAAFEPASGSQFCTGQRIQFTDLSTPSAVITDWQWDFNGDGTTDSNDQNPASVYNTEGTKTVRLIVIADYGVTTCADTVVQELEILEAPQAEFSFRHRSCAQDPVEFTDESTPAELISRWEWDFGDGSPTVTITNPPAENGTVTHGYTTTGTFDVTLIVTVVKNTGEVSDTLRQEIVILPADSAPPLCSFFVDADGKIVVDIADNETGISEVTIIEVRNGNVADEGGRFNWSDGFESFVNGIAELKLIVSPINPGRNIGFTIEIRDLCRNLTRCDPVVLTAASDNSFENEFVLPRMDKYLYVNNRGLQRINITINSQLLEIIADPIRRDRVGHRQYVPDYGDASLNIEELLLNEQNQIRIEVTGPNDSDAQVVFSDVQFSATSSPLPQAFALYQNYPNPFNPSTKIEFTVPEGVEAGVTVVLMVYNTFGQTVKKLVDDMKQPGAYSAVWDGTDEAGRIASSGIYFYRIIAGDFVATKRMLLIK